MGADICCFLMNKRPEPSTFHPSISSVHHLLASNHGQVTHLSVSYICDVSSQIRGKFSSKKYCESFVRPGYEDN